MAAKSNRFLGLELGGNRSQRTSLVVIEYFTENNKAFVVEILHPLRKKNINVDREIIELINAQSFQKMGINAPLTLPPCTTCKLKCPGAEDCKVPQVSWMRNLLKQKKKQVFPYLQRPVDLLEKEIWSKEQACLIHVDETLGAGRAPLAARVSYLKRHFNQAMIEVNPRLALASIAPWFKISARELRLYRDVEGGIENRLSILEKLTAETRFSIPKMFFYQSDLNEMAKNINSFDAFFAALMALFSERDLLEEADFDESWGWIAKPIQKNFLIPSRREHVEI